SERFATTTATGCGRATSSTTRSKPRTPRSKTTASCPRTTASTVASGRSAARSCSAHSSGSSSVTRPPEVRVGDRVPVRIVGREAERAVDACLELFGDDVLEPIGLVVHVVDVEPERVREVELEQPVVADHLDGDALSRPGEACAAGRLVIE